MIGGKTETISTIQLAEAGTLLKSNKKNCKIGWEGKGYTVTISGAKARINKEK